MVESKKIRKCKMCTNAGPVPDDWYRYCQLKQCEVWAESVACNDYDDTEIF